jgi:hypothetical protein
LKLIDAIEAVLPMSTENKPPTVEVETVSSKIAVPPDATVYILNLKLYVVSDTANPTGVDSLPWYERVLENCEVAAFTGEEKKSDATIKSAVKALTILVLVILLKVFKISCADKKKELPALLDFNTRGRLNI